MNKTIIKNIFSLLSIQGMNYLIPLLTLPYLVRILTPYGYGILGFCLAITQYFVYLIDYGFNLSATQKIAKAKNDCSKISEVFWNVIFCKVLLFILSILIIFTLSFINSKISDYFNIIISCYTLVLGGLLFPVWLFQGKEEMSIMAIVNIISKLMVVPLIFVFVKDENDIWIAALLTGLGSVISGLISLIIIFLKKWVIWISPTLKKIISEFVDGWHIFLSTIAISLYTTSVTVILGFLSSPIIVGYFVAADKIRLAAQGIIIPISQAIYPRINKLYDSDKNKAFDLISKLLLYQGGFTLIISINIYIFSSSIISILYGDHYISSVDILKILSCLPFLVGISNVLGIQTLIVANYKKEFSRILITSGIFNILIITPFIYLSNNIGAPISIVLTELLVILLMTKVILKNKIPIFIFRKKNEI